MYRSQLWFVSMTLLLFARKSSGSCLDAQAPAFFRVEIDLKFPADVGNISCSELEMFDVGIFLDGIFDDVVAFDPFLGDILNMFLDSNICPEGEFPTNCCSSDGASCDIHDMSCGASESNCLSASCGGSWIEITKASQCLDQFDVCSDPSDCCGNMTCIRSFKGHMVCDSRSETSSPSTALPTAPPTSSPSTAPPTAPPTSSLMVTTGGRGSCCTYTYLACDNDPTDYCETEFTCENDCSGIWADLSLNAPNCLGIHSSCSIDADCCGASQGDVLCLQGSCSPAPADVNAAGSDGGQAALLSADNARCCTHFYDSCGYMPGDYCDSELHCEHKCNGIWADISTNAVNCVRRYDPCSSDSDCCGSSNGDMRCDNSQCKPASERVRRKGRRELMMRGGSRLVGSKENAETYHATRSRADSELAPSSTGRRRLSSSTYYKWGGSGTCHWCLPQNRDDNTGQGGAGGRSLLFSLRGLFAYIVDNLRRDLNAYLTEKVNEHFSLDPSSCMYGVTPSISVNLVQTSEPSSFECP